MAPRKRAKTAAPNIPKTTTTGITREDFQALISTTVKAVVTELRSGADHSSETPVSPATDHSQGSKAMSDSDALPSSSVSTKGPVFQRSGNQEHYDALSSISKCVQDTIVALERGFDSSFALASAKNAKLLLENRISKLILADRVGSWSVADRVCDDTASFVTDPVAKKALEKWNSLQGRQLFRGPGVSGGPSKRRFFEKSSDQASVRRPRSRSRSPIRPRFVSFTDRSTRSTSQRRPGSDDKCHKCHGFGHWAPDCPSVGAGSNSRISGHARTSGQSGFANERR